MSKQPTMAMTVVTRLLWKANGDCFAGFYICYELNKLTVLIIGDGLFNFFQ